MAYLLILRRHQAEKLPIPMEEMGERFMAWSRGLADSGVLRSVERLKPAAEGITLRHEGNELVTELGPNARPDVIGYYLIDVADLDEAQRHAKDCPILAVGGSVEIRETEPFMQDPP